MSITMKFYAAEIENFETMGYAERRQAVVNAGLERAKKHTKATLKGVFRVKPKADEYPVGEYKNDYKQTVRLYTLSQCEPMREKTTKPRTEAQIAAANKLKQASTLNSRKGRAKLKCKSFVERGAVVIDTETTDLNGYVIQIAVVCCATRKVLYNSYVATDKPISSGAFAIHGISAKMLVNAPKPEVVAEQVKAVIGDKQVIAFNANFDEHVCKNTFGNDFVGKGWFCAMYKIAVPVFGSTNRHGSISLATAMGRAGLTFQGAAHQASTDALATVDLIRQLAAK